MTDPIYELVVIAPARRALTEQLPEAVATAVIEFLRRRWCANPPGGRAAASRG